MTHSGHTARHDGAERGAIPALRHGLRSGAPRSVREWARAEPRRRALVSSLGERSFGELDAAANRIAHTLRELVPEDGGCVALLARNRPEWVEVYLGCQRAGLELAPLNWHLPAPELAALIRQCGARVLIADAQLADLARAQRLACPRLEWLFSIGGGIPAFARFDLLLAGQSSAPLEPVPRGRVLRYTAGTTGRPKTVVGGASPDAWGLPRGHVRRPDAVALCSGPLHDTAARLLSLRVPLSHGMAVVLMDAFDPVACLRLIEQHAVSEAHLAPHLLHRLLQLPRAQRDRQDVASLELVLHGGAPLPSPLKQRAIEWLGPLLYEYYGAAEAVATGISSQEWLERPGSVGRPLIAGAIQIRDEDGRIAPPDTIGSVWLAGGDERFAYLVGEGREDGSAGGADPFFALGDQGYLDQDGYLFLTGRTAELIVSEGVAISPAEVDGVIVLHPAVADAATIGAPNDVWGEEVRTVVQLAPGYRASSLLGHELLEFCRRHLPRYRCPRSIEFAGELPRSESGKLYRRRVRDSYWSTPGLRTLRPR
jgi:long-chain acyl-CoA synthetase